MANSPGDTRIKGSLKAYQRGTHPKPRFSVEATKTYLDHSGSEATRSQLDFDLYWGRKLANNMPAPPTKKRDGNQIEYSGAKESTLSIAISEFSGST